MNFYNGQKKHLIIISFHTKIVLAKAINSRVKPGCKTKKTRIKNVN